MLVKREYLWPMLRDAYDACMYHFVASRKPYYLLIGERGGGTTLALSLLRALHEQHGGTVAIFCCHFEAANARSAELPPDIPVLTYSCLGYNNLPGIDTLSDEKLHEVFTEALQKGVLSSVTIFNIADYQRTANRVLDVFIGTAINQRRIVLVDSSPTVQSTRYAKDYTALLSPDIMLSAWDSNPNISQASWRKLVDSMDPSERASFLHCCGGGSPYAY